MRILLDENFPIEFSTLIQGHEVLTVYGLGWAGVKNGDLMRRASSVCEIFLTLDRNLEFQQNTKIFSFGIIVVHSKSNRLQDLRAVVPAVLNLLNQSKPGTVLQAKP